MQINRTIQRPTANLKQAKPEAKKAESQEAQYPELGLSQQDEVKLQSLVDNGTVEMVRVAGAYGPVKKAGGFLKTAAVAGAVGFAATMAAGAATAFTASSPLLAAAGVGAAAVGGYLAADFGSGVFHHAMDNYAQPGEGAIGEMAVEFLSHHYFANSMEQMETANNVDPTVLGGAPILLGTAAVAALGAATGSVGLAAGAVGVATAVGGGLFAQISHKWTHQAEPPKFVKTLRKLGIAQDDHDHRAHHMAPWTGNYCIVNGAMNPLLDKTNFWRKYEKAVYKLTGAEPKSWKHPAVKDYALGKISAEELDQRFKPEIKQFKENVGYAEEKEFARNALHERFAKAAKGLLD